jgi:hypothetical protein
MRGASARSVSIRAAVVAAMTLVAVAAGAAPPSEEAEKLIQHGVELRRQGKNGEALSEFQKAYELAPTPRGQAQIALALHAVGDWLGAERGLEEALRTEDDPWIAQYRDVLEGALATVRAHLGRLSVAINAAAGELLLNGVAVHTLPLSAPIRVTAGTLDIEVRAAGYAPAKRTIEIAAGTERHETFVLELLPPPAPVPPPTPGVVPPVAAPERSSAEGPPAPASPGHFAGYVALGAAGAFAGGGVAAWIARQDNVAIYNDDGRCLVGTRTRGQECGQYADAANRALALEIAAFSAAGGAAVLGTWLLWTPRRKPAGAAWCAPWGRVGLACTAEF